MTSPHYDQHHRQSVTEQDHAGSGPLGSLEGPYKNAFNEYYPPVSEAIAEIRALREEMESCHAELEANIANVQQNLRDQTDARTAAKEDIKHLNEHMQELKRSTIVDILTQEYNVEIGHIKHKEYLDSLINQMELTQKFQETLDKVLHRLASINENPPEDRSENESLQIYSTLGAIEHERSSIADELELRVFNPLSQLAARLSQRQASLSQEFTPQPDSMLQSAHFIHMILASVNAIIMELDPQIPEIGLSGALQKYTQMLKTAFGERIKTCVRIPTEFDLDISQVVFKVICEAVNNAILYSEADTIQITAGETNDTCMFFMVEDNGVGFDVDYVMAKTHHLHGLGRLKAAIEQLDLQLGVASAPNKGARISVIIPLSSEEDEGEDFDFGSYSNSGFLQE